jgi:hypothetical protein
MERPMTAVPSDRGGKPNSHGSGDYSMGHDIVIRNGTIVDGSGRDPLVGDVAIDGGTITSVGVRALVAKSAESWARRDLAPPTTRPAMGGRSAGKASTHRGRCRRKSF